MPALRLQRSRFATMSSLPLLAEMGLDVTEAERQELMCTYAALILHDDKIEITSAKITDLVEAAGGKVEPFWPKLFAQILAGRNVDDLLNSAGGAPGAGGAPAAGGAGGAEPAKQAEVEKEEEPEEEQGDMGFSLFD